MENLTRYLRAGADIALFSGGKAIGGPRRRASSSAASASSRPWRSTALRPRHRSPHEGGQGGDDRPAHRLELYLARDHEADIARWQRYLACIAEAAASAPGVRCQTVYGTTDAAPVPRLEVILDAAEAQVTPEQAFNRLLYGEPRIRVAQAGRGLLVNPMMLREGEAEVVAQRVAEVLSSSRPEDAEIDGRITPHQWALDNLVL